MLVIRRRVGESILIDGRIEIQLMELGPSRIKLGIQAPPDVIILRKEILLAEQENRAAAMTPEGFRSLAAIVARGGTPR